MGAKALMLFATIALLSGCSSMDRVHGPMVGASGPILATQDAEPEEVPVVEEDAPVVAEDVAPVEAAEIAEPAPERNVLFQRNLNDKPNGTYGDAYRLALILYYANRGDVERSKSAVGPANARRELINLGLIDANWDAGSGNIEHQDAAFIFAQTIELEGGVLWSLTDSRRYAHREMIDRKFFPKENPRQYMSGPGLMSAFRDCREHIRLKSLE